MRSETKVGFLFSSFSVASVSKNRGYERKLFLSRKSKPFLDKPWPFCEVNRLYWMLFMIRIIVSSKGVNVMPNSFFALLVSKSEGALNVRKETNV